MKKFILILTVLLINTITANAFEECIIITDEKLDNINIENKSIVEISPLITISNNKNILLVSPLKEGKTKFSILKNQQDIIKFNIKITTHNTNISDNKGFDILSLDNPDEEIFGLDLPPIKTDELELDLPPTELETDKPQNMEVK